MATYRYKVQLFASLKDRVNRSSIEVAFTSDEILKEQLFEQIGLDFPDLKELLPYCRLALNQNYTLGEEQLKPGDELALIPPVSGG